MDVDGQAEVIIVGSGQAGVPLAARLAAAGRQVIVVERGALGGTCVNIGCTPTKTMIASARAAHVARTAPRLGVEVHSVHVDFAAVVARKDAIVERWRQGVKRSLTSAGEKLRVVKGHARFVGERTIEVAGQRYQAKQVVINVGARAAIPDLSGLNTVPALNSTGVLGLRELPRHLLVLGGGYIGCELGQMFRRFGAEVTIVQSSQHLLSNEDEDVSQIVEEAFRAEGITLILGKSVQRVAVGPGAEISLELEGGTVSGDKQMGAGQGSGAVRAPVRGSHLLVATGRRPNTDDLSCDRAGVSLDQQGYVTVNERYETTAPDVFAVGDCTPGPQFTHVSWDDHRVLFDLLGGRATRARSDRLVPYAVFTDPQVAGIGLSEREARARGLAVEVARMPFGNIARAIETDETAGLVKVLIDPTSERVLGAQVVGVDAGELIHVFSTLMQTGASARAIVDAEFVHPTFAEGLQTAVMKLPRYALY